MELFQIGFIKLRRTCARLALGNNLWPSIFITTIFCCRYSARILYTKTKNKELQVVMRLNEYMYVGSIIMQKYEDRHETCCFIFSNKL